jgi:transglutaminase-like putative cysteine protease
MTVVQRSGWVFDTNVDARTTMQRMAGKVRDCVANSREVIDTANDIVSVVPPRDILGQIHAIYDWLLRRFRFVADPVNVELLRDPAGAVKRINARGFTQGDCDEAAMLGASLGMANGIRARFRALAFAPGAPYTHVIADLRGSDGAWYPLDITRPQGFTPPPVVRTLTVMV